MGVLGTSHGTSPGGIGTHQSVRRSFGASFALGESLLGGVIVPPIAADRGGVSLPSKVVASTAERDQPVEACADKSGGLGTYSS